MTKTQSDETPATPTSAALSAKIDELEEELVAASTKAAGHQAEQAGLVSRAYIQDDPEARIRLDELNTSLGGEQRRCQNMETALALLREQEAATRTREEEQARAAKLTRLEGEVPKAYAAAERTAEAIVERARELRPLVVDHEVALETYNRLRCQLAGLQGTEIRATYAVGEIAPARLAVRIVEAISLPSVVGADQAILANAATEGDLVAAFFRGREEGRREVETGARSIGYVPDDRSAVTRSAPLSPVEEYQRQRLERANARRAAAAGR